jgi:oligopeptide transport system substrate-binding protein
LKKIFKSMPGRSLYIWVLLCVLFMSACSTQEDRTADSRTVFRYNEANGITSLDPAFARSQTNIWAVNQLFNGLVQMNDRLEVMPCIAKSWDISSEGLVYTFHLRKDVYFHDDAVFEEGRGRRVTASDFAYSFRRIVDPAVASTGAWIFSDVKGAEDGSYTGFSAPDDSTLVIQLEHPFPPFIGLLTNVYCSVVAEEAVQRYGRDFRSHPVGTGPFRFSRWKEGEMLVMLKNPSYFEQENGQRLPYLDAVAVSFLTDKQAEFMEFVQGKLDFLNSLDASYKDELINKLGELQPKYRQKFRMETLPYLNTEYLGILVDDSAEVTKNSPLKLKAVRQAISCGFDREKMIMYMRNSMGTPGAHGIIPPGLPGFSTAVKGYSYDPARAKQLLREAGFPGGRGLPEMTLSATPVYADLCEYIQSQLSETGIRLRIEINQSGTHREMVARQKLSFFRASWIADYPDAENYLSLFYSKNFAPGGPNTTHFRNARYDLLYEQARTETDTTARYRLYREMDQLLMEEAPAVILYYDKVLRLYQNNISGIRGNAMNLLTLKYTRKQP